MVGGYVVTLLARDLESAARHFSDEAINWKTEDNAAIVYALLALKCSVDELAAAVASKGTC